MKICCKCKKNKESNCYYKCGYAQDGIGYTCKDCLRMQNSFKKIELDLSRQFKVPEKLDYDYVETFAVSIIRTKPDLSVIEKEFRFRGQGLVFRKILTLLKKWQNYNC